jgi:hypothetical protein
LVVFSCSEARKAQHEFQRRQAQQAQQEEKEEQELQAHHEEQEQQQPLQPQQPKLVHQKQQEFQTQPLDQLQQPKLAQQGKKSVSVGSTAFLLTTAAIVIFILQVLPSLKIKTKMSLTTQYHVGESGNLHILVLTHLSKYF